MGSGVKNTDRKMPGLLALFLVVVIAPFAAASTALAYTGSEYPTKSAWAIGTVVSVDDTGIIVAASTAARNYVGVIAAAPSNGSVQVANTGTVSVLVSDKEGAITSGARIGLSSIAGVATAWVDGEVAIGVVQEAPTTWQKAELKGAGTVNIASAKVQILTDGASASSSSNVFYAAIQKTAAGVAGKQVDTWRIITALLIGVGGLILAFGLLFISSRESFFSMGRNPMAGKIIMRGLWKIVALSVGIMCVTLFAAYLIVRVS